MHFDYGTEGQRGANLIRRNLVSDKGTTTNSAWIKRKEYSFAQYEHAHRLRLISEFFRLQDRHRGTACVFDTVGVEE